MYSEITERLDTKFNATSSTGCSFTPGRFEISDLNLMLKSILPDDVKVIIIIDDIRLRANLSSKKTMKSIENSFLYTKPGFTQSQSGPIGDIERLFRKVPCTYKREEHFNITGIDNSLLKCDCFNGSFVNGVREPTV